MVVNVRTCYSEDCISCWEDYNQCDDCENGVYALLSDNNNACYPTNQIVKGYIYEDSSKIFNKCYPSCEFCSASSSDITEHNCESCAEGYLQSYQHYGNCYKINYILLTDNKTIDNANDENYIPTTCTKYKIHSTGEYVDECPIISPFYSYEYNTETEDYSKNDNLIPPKYLFNKICYETCSSNANTIADNIDNIWKCEYAFLFQEDEITCYSDLNCISDYPYKNEDSNQCYSSLDECNYFFNNICMKTVQEVKYLYQLKAQK